MGREFPADGSAQFAEERQRFAADVERGDVYVALDGERIVGAVRTKPQEKDLYIHQIAVDPARQGGLGVDAATRWSGSGAVKRLSTPVPGKPLVEAVGRMVL